MADNEHRHLFKNLLILSRFTKYNPLFATFAGVWGTLLAGATKMADQPSAISLAFVFRQTCLSFLFTWVFCGAGMVWDDWVDRDIDAKVARTKNRPLASGKVTTTEAIVWMLMQVIGSWYLLDIMLEGKDVWKHFLPIIMATMLYPYGKRPLMAKFGLYPQYILGFDLAWPAIPGWAALYGQSQTFTETVRQCLPLCIMVFFWTTYFNTAYSYQDVVDDRKMNLNSFYCLGGSRIHHLLVALVGPVLVCLPFFLREINSTWLWISWMGVWTATFAHQLIRFDPKRPASGGNLHRSNFMLGIWTIVACAVEVSFKHCMRLRV